ARKRSADPSARWPTSPRPRSPATACSWWATAGSSRTGADRAGGRRARVRRAPRRMQRWRRRRPGGLDLFLALLVVLVVVGRAVDHDQPTAVDADGRRAVRHERDPAAALRARRVE